MRSSDVERLDPPSKLKVTALSRVTVQIAFTPPIGVAAGVIKRYRLEWSTNNRFQPVAGELECGALHCSAIRVDHLRPNVPYYFRLASGTDVRFGPNRLFSEQAFYIEAWSEKPSYSAYARQYTRTFEQYNMMITEQLNRILSQLPNHDETLERSRWTAVAKLAMDFSKRISGEKYKCGIHLITLIMSGDKLLMTKDRVPPIHPVDEQAGVKAAEFDEFVRWVSLLPQKSRSINACHILQKKLPRNPLNRLKARFLTVLGDVMSVYGVDVIDYFHHSAIMTPSTSTAKFLVCCIDNFQSDIPWSMSMRLYPHIVSEAESMENAVCRHVLKIICDRRKAEKRPKPGLYVGLLQFVSSQRQMCVLTADSSHWALPTQFMRPNAFLTRREWLLLSMHPALAAEVGSRAETDLFARFKDTCEALFRAHGLDYEREQFRLWTECVFEDDGVTILLLLPKPENVCLFHTDLTSKSFEQQRGKRSVTPLISFHMEYLRNIFPDLLQNLTKVKTFNDLLLQILKMRFNPDQKECSNRCRRVAEEHDKLSKEFSEAWKLICWTNEVITKARDKNIDCSVGLDRIFQHYETLKQLAQTSPTFALDGRTIKVRIDDGTLNCLGVCPYAIVEVNEKTTAAEVVQLVVKSAFRDEVSHPAAMFDLVLTAGLRERRLRAGLALGALAAPWTSAAFSVRHQRAATACSSGSEELGGVGPQRWRVLPW